MFKNKVLLITGGTGSFGNAVLDRFLHTNCKEIRIFSRDEKKQDEMKRKYNNSKIKFFIGNVRDYPSVKTAMRGVDYVFHAAALKQVPSCEDFPLEAVKTNVLGTENVINAAIEEEVEKVVCLSTDKSAYPINAMGISKAMMEKVFVAKAKNAGKTIICGTRFGNVMASRGSVIPLFVEQINEGKPLTVTNPEMTRYLMSLEEAVELVFFAFVNGNAGDIFVHKAPASNIGDLAQAMKEVFHVENEIKIIGRRPGEKDYESLLTEEEHRTSVDMGEFFRVPAEVGKTEETVTESMGYHSNNAECLTVEEIKEKLLQLTYIQEELEKWDSNNSNVSVVEKVVEESANKQEEKGIVIPFPSKRLQLGSQWKKPLMLAGLALLTAGGIATFVEAENQIRINDENRIEERDKKIINEEKKEISDLENEIDSLHDEIQVFESHKK